MTSLVYAPSDRWAVVTGAARGLGKAISERLAAVGFLVAGIDLSDTIHASAKSLPGEGHVGVVGDATAPEALAEAFAVIPADARLSVFVANAGITDPGDSLTYRQTSRMRSASWRRTSRSTSPASPCQWTEDGPPWGWGRTI